ncbi:hypothetical protein [Williamsia sp. CHRR-6]|uniref:hypothetical protein n=1 Tax=Williamsia sp. CHRR-6 TaxID=2835871 RepID=UPI001BD936A2|nr:hypothetical protein [Williamsia sp. CHRR-6]MBT0568222.1 hypothetical protein [Williamsia sp. CHRR-6]
MAINVEAPIAIERDPLGWSTRARVEHTSPRRPREIVAVSRTAGLLTQLGRPVARFASCWSAGRHLRGMRSLPD